MTPTKPARAVPSLRKVCRDENALFRSRAVILAHHLSVLGVPRHSLIVSDNRSIWMAAEAEYRSVPGAAFLEPQETAAQLLARTFVAPLRSGVPVIDQHTALRPGHIVEIAGGPGTAKSELLLQVSVRQHWSVLHSSLPP